MLASYISVEYVRSSVTLSPATC